LASESVIFVKNQTLDLLSLFESLNEL